MKKVMIFFLVSILFLGFAVAQSEEDPDYWQSQITTGEQNTGASGEGVEPGYHSEIELEIAQEKGFCGSSTFATCEEDKDCIVSGCSQSVCQGASEEPAITTCEFRECYNANTFNAKCGCVDKRCQWNKLTEGQAREIITEKLSEEFQNETIELNDDGNYQYSAERNAKLFFLFSVKIRVEAEVNSETGEIKIKVPWWSFLTSEVKDETSSDWNAEGGTMLAGSESNLTDEELAAA